MSRYRLHVFVCENVRSPDNPRGSCGQKGSAKLREALKAEVKKRGLGADVRVNAAGCLDGCEHGPTMVVYPEAVWYGGVKPEDLPDILEQHLVGGRPVERLLIRDYMTRSDRGGGS